MKRGLFLLASLSFALSSHSAFAGKMGGGFSSSFKSSGSSYKVPRISSSPSKPSFSSGGSKFKSSSSPSYKSSGSSAFPRKPSLMHGFESGGESEAISPPRTYNQTRPRYSYPLSPYSSSSSNSFFHYMLLYQLFSSHRQNVVVYQNSTPVTLPTPDEIGNAPTSTFDNFVTGSAEVNGRSDSVQRVLRFYLQGDGGFNAPVDSLHVATSVQSSDQLQAQASAFAGRIETQQKAMQPLFAQRDQQESARLSLQAQISQKQQALGEDFYTGVIGTIDYVFTSQSTYDSYERDRAQQQAAIDLLTRNQTELEQQTGLVSEKLMKELGTLKQLKDAETNLTALRQGWVKRGVTPSSTLALYNCDTGLTAYEYAPTTETEDAREPFGDEAVPTEGLASILACADGNGRVENLVLVDRSKLAGDASVFKMEVTREDGRLQRVRVVDGRDQEIESASWTKTEAGQINFATEFIDDKGAKQTLSIEPKSGG